MTPEIKRMINKWIDLLNEAREQQLATYDENVGRVTYWDGKICGLMDVLVSLEIEYGFEMKYDHDTQAIAHI